MITQPCNIKMPEKYLDNALVHTQMGKSQIYAAAFLHRLIFGRTEEDNKSQLYLTSKSIVCDPQEFFDLTVALCEGKDKLNELEQGNSDVTYEKVLKMSGLYKLMATVGPDPTTGVNKFQVRWQVPI